MNRKNRNKPRLSGVSLVANLLQRPVKTPSGEWPFVSVICPSFNRREFLPYLLYIFQYQDYPADRRELVILDDSAQSNQDLVDMLVDPRVHLVRYIHSAKRLALGEKRNQLNALAKGEYIVCFDDDDYYPPDKISWQIGEMRASNALFSGSDQIYVWYSHLDKIYKTHAFGSHYALNGTFAYHRNFLRKHRYQDDLMLAEEGSFLNGFTAPVQQVDPRRAILCISHSANTYDKDFIMGSSTPVELQLSDFVQDANLLAHYHRLSHTPVTQPVHWAAFDKVVMFYDPTRPDEKERQQQALLAFGISDAQLEVVAAAGPSSSDTATLQTHISLLERAQTLGWRNVLLLDSRIRFVKQERVVRNVNRLLDSLASLKWNVVMLGVQHVNLRLMTSLPGVARINEGDVGCAYAVNQHYYPVLLDDYRQALAAGTRLDAGWTALMQRHLWLAVYPSFAYLSRDFCQQEQREIDCTHRFFRKRTS